MSSGFASVGEVVDAHTAGKTTFFTWRKSPSQATTQANWIDLSMMPGLPIPNYYASAPAVAATLPGNEGMFHGGAVSPSSKHLRRLMGLATVATALPMPMILCDYLLYYPFVDMSTTDEQSMTNSTTLPRYTDGEGVQLMVVITNPPGAQNGITFSVDYTNQDGTAGRTTPVQSFGSASVTGTIATTSAGGAQQRSPFVSLQGADTGVRSVETFRMISGTDVGLVALVLVKPLAQASIRGIDAPVEVDYLQHFSQLPRIVDGAYLNLIACPMGSLAATAIHGTIETVWS